MIIIRNSYKYTSVIIRKISNKPTICHTQWLFILSLVKTCLRWPKIIRVLMQSRYNSTVYPNQQNLNVNFVNRAHQLRLIFPHHQHTPSSSPRTNDRYDESFHNSSSNITKSKHTMNNHTSVSIQIVFVWINQQQQMKAYTSADLHCQSSPTRLFSRFPRLVVNTVTNLEHAIQRDLNLLYSPNGTTQ